MQEYEVHWRKLTMLYVLRNVITSNGSSAINDFTCICIHDEQRAVRGVSITRVKQEALTRSFSMRGIGC